jgi:hypothetical protein
VSNRKADGKGKSRARVPLSEEERARIRKAGMEDARRSRKRQGLPERIEDTVAVAILAALLRSTQATKTNRETSDGRKEAA